MRRERYGADKRGDELPDELAFREGRLEKIRGCPTTKRSVTSPMPSRELCPRQEVGTLCRRTTVRQWWIVPIR